MSLLRNQDYRNIPFISETDFYVFGNICKLVAKCKEDREKVIKCRTIGILESINGRFILKEINCKNDTSQIRVSMVYLKIPLPSIVIPYVVQLFGTLHWEEQPVIFANVVQVINTTTAIKLNGTLNSIIRLHLANHENGK